MLERVRDRGMGVISLVDPRNRGLLDDATMNRLEGLSDLVITGQHDTASYLAQVTAGAGKGTIVGVCPTLHLMALTAAEIAEQLVLPGPGSDRLRTTLNKARVRAITTGAGLRNPRVCTICADDDPPDELADLSFPVVVKPVDGYGKFGTIVAGSRAQLDEHVSRFGRLREQWQREGGAPSAISPTLLVEEFIRGVLFSVECYAGSEGAKALVAVRRKTSVENPVLELGSTIPGTDSAEDAVRLHAYAEAVLDALELSNGVFHVEMILSEDGPVLVEVNPRISGGAIPDLVRMATGINLWDILIDVAIGQRPRPDQQGSHQPMSHTFLAARESFVVPGTLGSDWFDRVTENRVAGYCDAVPGQQVPAMANNTTAFGIVRFAADTVRGAEERCDKAVAAIGSALGAQLWAPSP
jgi:biotin carboxylase